MNPNRLPPMLPYDEPWLVYGVISTFPGDTDWAQSGPGEATFARTGPGEATWSKSGPGDTDWSRRES